MSGDQASTTRSASSPTRSGSATSSNCLGAAAIRCAEFRESDVGLTAVASAAHDTAETDAFLGAYDARADIWLGSSTLKLLLVARSALAIALAALSQPLAQVLCLLAMLHRLQSRRLELLLPRPQRLVELGAPRAPRDVERLARPQHQQERQEARRRHGRGVTIEAPTSRNKI